MFRRTVEIVQDENFLNIVGGNAREVDNAIGYLSRWSLDAGPRHVKLRLFLREDGNIDALYLGENGQMTYEIGAIWDGSRYSFHS